VVEDTRGVDGLESQHLVVKVTDEKTLCGESIGLDVDIGPGDTLEERRFADIGITTDD
jgi:hypothetical protein